MAKKILIVEDDKNISKLIKYNLEKAGFECVVAHTGESSLRVLDKNSFDLIILDIMLGKMDGLEVCSRIKQDKNLSDIPIIMLTAKGEEVDRIVGFELGADDYMVKPFSPRELVLRVKAILKRGKREDNLKEILSVGALKMDISRHKVMIGDHKIELTQMEFNLLLILIERIGHLQSRERLLNDVWSIDSDVTTRTIDTHIKRLRKKLGKLGSMIETVRGLGYKFKEDD
ncbi:MAG: response regulator transcription factor [Elusimicrobia bacterium]|nr:response regulator transcription factor [Elusimicrobiota bacterium]